MNEGTVPEDLQEAYLVPINEWKGKRCQFKNLSGIYTPSIHGKVFDKVMLEIIRYASEWRMGEKLC